jgi:hypothetical protein
VVIALVAGLLVGLIVLAAVLDLPLNLSVVQPIGVLTLAFSYFALGVLTVGGWIELRHREASRLSVTDKVVLGVVWVLLAVSEVLVAVVVVPRLEAPVVAGYFVLAAVAAVAGGWYSLSRMWPTRYRQTGTYQRPFGPAAGLLGAVIGVVIVAGTIVGFSEADNRETGGGPPIAAAGQPGWKTVALGDSYSAGEGLGPFIDGTSTTGCDRSNEAYAELLARAESWHLVDFAACSGAVIDDVYHARDATVGPQVTGADPSVNLVTLTIGGNDSLFSSVLVQCIEHPDCLADQFPPVRDPWASRPPPGAGAASTQTQPLVFWGLQRVKDLGPAELSLFNSLKKDFHNARIVVVGYPPLLPTGAAPLFPPECFNILRRADQATRQVLFQLESDLNEQIYRQAQAAGIEFVSPDAMWAGHDACDSKSEYTHSAIVVLDPSHPVGSGSFHPTPAGQDALAATVACYLAAHPERMTAYPSVPPTPNAQCVQQDEP